MIVHEAFFLNYLMLIIIYFVIHIQKGKDEKLSGQ